MAHQRGRALLNRLTALTASAELLGESAAREGTSADLRASAESLRAELADAARAARDLVDGFAAQLPAPDADLADALRDTLAPLRRHLARRETRLVVGEIPQGVRVAVDPELLRAAIAAALSAAVGSALPSEVLRVEHTRARERHAVAFVLETRAPVPESASVDAELASLRSWLEVRGGALHVAREAGRIAVELELPSTKREKPC
jgi:hypothetical protein